MTNRIFERKSPDLLMVKCPLDGYWYFDVHTNYCEHTHSEYQTR